MHVAMWSGPRNLSTAMMYSFGARRDFTVVDEPFYGAYLAQRDTAHPMRDEILASMETDPQKIAQQMLAPVGTPHFYQKQMCHHMLPGFPLDWMESVINVFLIRHPARVIASYAKIHPPHTLRDIGFEQQTMLFDRLISAGIEPVVIQSGDIRDAPEAMLRALCDRIGLPWDAAMLSWPKGGHPSDGIWARYWYSEIHQSTGFAGPEGPLPKLEGEAGALLEQAMPHFERLHALRLRG